MIDYLDIGPTPCDEDCESLGDGYRPDVARRECRAYVNQLKRIHGGPPPGASFRVKANRHDFGTYHEVVVRFDEAEPDAEAYAFKVEAHTPNHWDDEARAELAAAIVL